MTSDDALYAELFGGPSPVASSSTRFDSFPTGPDEPPPPTDASDETVLAWAQRTGRIAAASRRTWEQNLSQDRAGANAALRILARVTIGPGAVAASAAARPRPVAAASGASYAPARKQTASGLDVSALPKRMQAAAAREADRSKVVGWLQQFGNAPEEDGDPAWLGMMGEGELAAAIARDEAEAASEEHQRMMAEGAAAQVAWRSSPDNPNIQAARRIEEGRDQERAVAAARMEALGRRNGGS